jgi:peptide/nickel transport system permease protein
MIGMSAISIRQSEYFGRTRPARSARFVRFLRTEPFVATCLALFVALAICTILPEVVAPSDPAIGQLSMVRKGPSLSHPFGTDALGRDVLSRVIYGTRISLEIGVVSTLLGAAV